MARTIGRVPFKCPARTHAVHEDGRLIRFRCRDNKCPEAQLAKSRGQRAYHVYDTEHYIPALGTYLSWTEYEPGDRQEQELAQ